MYSSRQLIFTMEPGVAFHSEEQKRMTSKHDLQEQVVPSDFISLLPEKQQISGISPSSYEHKQIYSEKKRNLRFQVIGLSMFRKEQIKLNIVLEN